MDIHLKEIAQTCLEAAEGGTMTFPEIVETLINKGFESYAIDFRRASATYYLPDGDSVVVPTKHGNTLIAGAFDTAAVQVALGKRNSLRQATPTQASAQK